MGKTGGGVGTNQYAVRGVSQANQQGMDVIDRLATGDGTDVANEAEETRERIRSKLISDLADAIIARDEEPIDPDYATPAWVTGSDTKPGVWQREEGCLEAWAWDPTDPGEAISVMERDSDGDASCRVAGLVESIRSAKRANEERYWASHRNGGVGAGSPRL